MFKNQLKTVILLGALSGLLIWIASMFGQNGLVIGLVFAIVMNVGSYFFSDKLVLWMYKAKPATEGEYPEFHKIVRELARKANMPMPKLYIVNVPHSNAFATGRSPKHAAVAVTTGILNLLTKDELRGVLAHEISHVKNRDILVATVAATIASVISYMAMMARFAAMFGGGRDRDNRGGGLAELLVLGILTPLIATLIQLAISRSREYLADESGARLIGTGKPLASALQKLHTDVKHHPLMPSAATETTAHMMISSPFSKAGWLVSIFQTHPPYEKRCERLNNIKF